MRITGKEIVSLLKETFGIEKLNEKLLFATEIGSKEFVEELLKAGADINTKDEEGRTPLMLATEKNNKEIIKILEKFL